MLKGNSFVLTGVHFELTTLLEANLEGAVKIKSINRTRLLGDGPIFFGKFFPQRIQTLSNNLGIKVGYIGLNSNDVSIIDESANLYSIQYPDLKITEIPSFKNMLLSENESQELERSSLLSKVLNQVVPVLEKLDVIVISGERFWSDFFSLKIVVDALVKYNSKIPLIKFDQAGIFEHLVTSKELSDDIQNLDKSEILPDLRLIQVKNSSYTFSESGKNRKIYIVENKISFLAFDSISVNFDEDGSYIPKFLILKSGKANYNKNSKVFLDFLKKLKSKVRVEIAKGEGFICQEGRMNITFSGEIIGAYPLGTTVTVDTTRFLVNEELLERYELKAGFNALIYKGQLIQKDEAIIKAGSGFINAKNAGKVIAKNVNYLEILYGKSNAKRRCGISGVICGSTGNNSLTVKTNILKIRLEGITGERELDGYFINSTDYLSLGADKSAAEVNKYILYIDESPLLPELVKAIELSNNIIALVVAQNKNIFTRIPNFFLNKNSINTNPKLASLLKLLSGCYMNVIDRAFVFHIDSNKQIQISELEKDELSFTDVVGVISYESNFHYGKIINYNSEELVTVQTPKGQILKRKENLFFI